MRKIQNSCYGEQEKRAKRKNRNPRLVLRIKDYGFVMQQFYMTEIMIRTWDLPTYRIHLLLPHPETHQVLPSGSHSFRIYKHSYLLCLL